MFWRIQLYYSSISSEQEASLLWYIILSYKVLKLWLGLYFLAKYLVGRARYFFIIIC